MGDGEMEAGNSDKLSHILGNQTDLFDSIHKAFASFRDLLPDWPDGLNITTAPITSALASITAAMPPGFRGLATIHEETGKVIAKFSESLAKRREVCATWFKWNFKGGFRCVLQQPYEWDFRVIESEYEAKAAWFYEYGREVEWLYRFAEPLLGGKSEVTNSDDRLRYLDSWIVWELPLYWPVPWALLNRDAIPVYAPKPVAPAVISVDMARWRQILEKGTQGRLRMLEIDWDRGFEKVCEDFKSWARKAAPPDAIGAKRGKRVKSSYLLKLKWLAAYRLSQAGLSHTRAKKLVQEARKKGGDSLGVLPYFESAGGWDGAVKKAMGILRADFAEPPARQAELAE